MQCPVCPLAPHVFSSALRSPPPAKMSMRCSLYFVIASINHNNKLDIHDTSE